MTTLQEQYDHHIQQAAEIKAKLDAQAERDDGFYEGNGAFLVTPECGVIEREKFHSPPYTALGLSFKHKENAQKKLNKMREQSCRSALKT